MTTTNKNTERLNSKCAEVYANIPVGEKRAITNHKLQDCLSFSITDQHLRKLIKLLRYQGKHIISSPKSGYWKPTTKCQKNKYDVFWKKHAKSITKTVSLEKKKRVHKNYKKVILALLSKKPRTSANQIVAKFHCSKSTAYKYIKEYKITSSKKHKTKKSK